MVEVRARAGLALAVVAVALAALCATGCRNTESEGSALDRALRARIAARGLTGDPSDGLALPTIDEPMARLGKHLFFTKALGGDMDVACASCHHPLLGGGDGLAVSIGVGAIEPDHLGPGRTHSSGRPNVARNAPTVFNSGLYRETLFHDGRIEILQVGSAGDSHRLIRTPDALPGFPDPRAGTDLVMAQARFPIVSPPEMLGYTYAAHKPHRTIRAVLSARLGDYGPGAGELDAPRWVEAFEAAFGSGVPAEALVTEQNIAAAIATYERSMRFVDSPWKAYVEGDDEAIGQPAKRGALAFLADVEEGGAGCAVCHSGDFFTDESFHVLAVPQVGPGRHDDPYADVSLSVEDDLGCWHATYREEDRYAFRTPSLWNVEVTGPYGHDGAYATLEGIVRHHLDPAAAIAAYDPAQLPPDVPTARMSESGAAALAKLAADRQLGRSLLPRVSLTDGEVRDIVAFLVTLTDPCVRDPACLAPWLPAPGEPDPDGHRLVARFATGKDLP